MRTRVLALLIAVSAIEARAQEFDLSGFRPVTVSAEVEVTETPSVSEPPDAGPPIAELPEVLDAGAPPAAPTPTEAKCTTTADCAKGFVCSGARPPGKGKWVKGESFCQALRLIRNVPPLTVQPELSPTAPRSATLIQQELTALEQQLARYRTKPAWIPLVAGLGGGVLLGGLTLWLFASGRLPGLMGFLGMITTSFAIAAAIAGIVVAIVFAAANARNEARNEARVEDLKERIERLRLLLPPPNLEKGPHSPEEDLLLRAGMAPVPTTFAFAF